MNNTVLFLCPHGAAKSIMAAAYFRKLAEAQGLAWHALAAGTDPAAEVAPRVVELLAQAGIDVAGVVPQRVSQEQMASAAQIISLGCELDTLPPADTPVVPWDDIPLPSQDLLGARDHIYARVAQLMNNLAR